MGKTAVVTGASRGIGRAIARELAQEGWGVCVNFLEQQAAAEALVKEIRAAGGRAFAYGAEVSERAQVAAMIRETERQLGTVGLLVNNAF